MQTLHTINIATHIFCGTLGLLFGLIALIYQNNARQHIRFGRYFLYCLTLVIATALVGILLFRSDPFLLILTLLSGYVGYSGYRTVKLRERASSSLDALIAVVALLIGGFYLAAIRLAGGSWSPVVVYSTLSALVIVVGYDLLKRYWLYQRLKTWWLYEHIYKMLSAFSALCSAFSGTVFSHYKPYSQILPSALCVSAIVYFIWRQTQKRVSPA